MSFNFRNEPSAVFISLCEHSVRVVLTNHEVVCVVEAAGLAGQRDDGAMTGAHRELELSARRRHQHFVQAPLVVLSEHRKVVAYSDNTDSTP